MHGLLIDLEGVLYEGDTPIPGVADAIDTLAVSGFEIRYLTNTTTRPRRAIVDRLIGMGFDLRPGSGERGVGRRRYRGRYRRGRVGFIGGGFTRCRVR